MKTIKKIILYIIVMFITLCIGSVAISYLIYKDYQPIYDNAYRQGYYDGYKEGLLNGDYYRGWDDCYKKLK